MNSLKVKGTNLFFPDRVNQSLHAEAFNVESTNSGGTKLSFVLSFIPMLDLARAGWKQAFLIWLDEYEMQISGRATEQG